MKRYKQDINPVTGKFALRMEVEGNTYTLFKKEQDKYAPWYVRLQRRGKDIWASLGTSDAELAQNRPWSRPR